MGLNIKRRPKKRLPARVKAPLTLPITQNIVWSMDFMSDSLIDGRRFRTLNIIDDFNREALWITIAISINAHRLIRELNKLIDYRGKPEEIRVDNGPEFTSLIFIDWAKANEINIRYIQPGKPMQNSLVERFNRSYREEILSAYLFNNLSQVRRLTYQWIDHYNFCRPHEALLNLTPMQFFERFSKASFAKNNYIKFETLSS